MAYIGLVLLFVLLPLPFAFLTYRLAGPDDEQVDAQAGELRIIDALALGYAVALCLLYACATFRLALFVPAWLLAFVAAGFVFGRKGLHRGFSWRLACSGEAALLFPIVGVYFVLRLVVGVMNPLPQGSDPYFHLLLVDRILQTGALVRDWMPFESIPVTYPLASHALIALFASLVRVPTHVVFNPLSLWFAALMGLQLFSLLSRVANRSVALYGTVAFLFAADMGSLGYYNWGGLPNEIGMYLFLGLLTLLAKPVAAGKQSAAFAFFFLGLSLAHHHCMLTAGTCLVGLGAFALVSPSRRPMGIRIVAGLIVSGFLGFLYYWRMLERSMTLSSTGIEGFVEPFLGIVEISAQVGLGFFFAALAGAWLALARGKENVPVLIGGTVVPLILLFLIFDYGCRAYSTLFLDRVIAPLSPSRFITDAVVLCSFFVGFFFHQIQQWTAVSRKVVLSTILLCSVYVLPAYSMAFRKPLSDEKLAAYAWIRRNAAPDAWVLDERVEASYLTKRASLTVPFPTSESMRTATILPRMDSLAAGKIPSDLGDRQVLLIAEDGWELKLPTKLVFASGNIQVRQLEPRSDANLVSD